MSLNSPSLQYKQELIVESKYWPFGHLVVFGSLVLLLFVVGDVWSEFAVCWVFVGFSVVDC